MPGLYLPRALYDLFIYHFTYNFSGIVGAYGACVYIVTGNMLFMHGLWVTDQGKAIQRPLRNCAVIAASVWKSYRAHADSIQRLCGDGTVAV